MTTALTSLLSPVSDHRVHRLVEELGRLGHDVRFLDAPWDERLRAARAGEVAGTWVCGLLHVELGSRGGWLYSAVAAPASSRPGTGGAAVYFGDVVVNRGAPYRTFDDLQGSTFAFNEEASLSGYRMMVDHLRSIGTDLEYFGTTRRSGSHRASLDMVLAGEADCAMIDSTITDEGIDGLDRVRIVHSVGPYPAPPLVVTPEWRDRVATAASAAGWRLTADSAYRSLVPGR
jgi:phosphonate transport system substrate-binding protein